MIESEGDIPAACFNLKALSSSSSSVTFFLGFLLWMGFVPAVSVEGLYVSLGGFEGGSV